ncbi:MAG: flotillin family protein [Ignavibacteriales bacterium]|nr:flotillin family protein [Ignavibacteriales bacterium]
MDEEFFSPMILIIVLILSALIPMLFILFNYKKCPTDKILIVYGKFGNSNATRYYHGRGVFVIPFLQSYKYLSLNPITIASEIQGMKTIKIIKVDISYKCIVGIGTEPNLMQNAAERLMNLNEQQIIPLAIEIINSQIKQIVLYTSMEDINLDQEKFTNDLIKEVEPNLNSIGLRIINFHLENIKINSQEFIGKEGIVLTSIKGFGRGKVNFSVGGQAIILDAVSNDLNEITDGERVVATKVNKENILVVNKY